MIFKDSESGNHVIQTFVSLLVVVVLTGSAARYL
jgi:hypothetical protein